MKPAKLRQAATRLEIQRDVLFMDFLSGRDALVLVAQRRRLSPAAAPS
jgi:hypothetical protein